jgi:hypothetical protein
MAYCHWVAKPRSTFTNSNGHSLAIHWRPRRYTCTRAHDASAQPLTRSTQHNRLQTSIFIRDKVILPLLVSTGELARQLKILKKSLVELTSASSTNNLLSPVHSRASTVSPSKSSSQWKVEGMRVSLEIVPHQRTVIDRSIDCIQANLMTRSLPLQC